MHYAVIMAGGSGQRLWPLSRKHRPKQIIDLFENQSLLQHSVNRIKDIFPPENILVITNAEYEKIVQEHLPQLPPENILGEPVGKDTANAIGLAATVLKQKDPDAIMAVFSADQIIEPYEPLHKAIQLAFNFIKKVPDALFTFGIKAGFAHTGLGYLKQGRPGDETLDGVFPVEAFKEKPNKNTARKYIRSGNYSWNSGMFIWKVSTILNQIDRFLPHNSERLEWIGQAWQTEHWQQTLDDEFPKLKKISIDYGIMERSTKVYMCQLDCHWLDIGSYQALAETLGKTDSNGNTTLFETLFEQTDSTNNIVISDSPDHLVSTINVENLVIVHTKDATLICHREETDAIKDLLNSLRESNHHSFI
jgi:mannose-1-phosphate guanylyltransferase